MKSLIRLAPRARGPVPRVTARFYFTARTLNALFTFRSDGRVRFRAAHDYRCRRHRRGLCQPVRRDRPGARHGHARCFRRYAGLAWNPSNPDAVPAQPLRAGRHLAGTARGFRGLFARGRLIPEVARGRELISLLREGAIDGLSIGFRVSKARIDPKTRIRRLHAVDLWEISIVTFPLLAGARVRAVKHATLKAKLGCARTRAEREWVKTTAAPRRS